MINQRLFLVGCPRSGTTLLQSLLAAHPAIISFPESHFFRHLYPEHEPRRRRYHLASCRIKSHLINFGNSIGAKDIDKCIKPWTLFQSQYIHLFVSMLDRIAQQNDNNIWLEKTPDHLQYIPLIERHIKRAKFIHIIRNGPDTIASLYEVTRQYPQHWGNKNWSIDACTEKWKEAIKISFNYRYKTNHIIVSYEQLTNNPTESIERIFAILGIHCVPEILSEYSRGGGDLIYDYEAWKKPIQTISKLKHKLKFTKVFSEEEQQYISEKIDFQNNDIDAYLRDLFNQETLANQSS